MLRRQDAAVPCAWHGDEKEKAQVAWKMERVTMIRPASRSLLSRVASVGLGHGNAAQPILSAFASPRRARVPGKPRTQRRRAGNGI